MKNKCRLFILMGWITGVVIWGHLTNVMASSYPIILSADRAVEISDEIASRVLERFDQSRSAEIFGGKYTLLDYYKIIGRGVIEEQEPVFVITYEHKSGQTLAGPPAAFLVFVYRQTGAVKVIMN